MQAVVVTKERSVAALVAEAASLEEQYKASMRTVSLQRQLGDLQAEAIWAQIHERQEVCFTA